jgi:hypothetical protein
VTDEAPIIFLLVSGNLTGTPLISGGGGGACATYAGSRSASQVLHLALSFTSRVSDCGFNKHVDWGDDALERSADVPAEQIRASGGSGTAADDEPVLLNVSDWSPTRVGGRGRTSTISSPTRRAAVAHLVEQGGHPCPSVGTSNRITLRSAV